MLYIRVDMNETIATGHIMRCLSIAEAAEELGEQAVFLLADEEAVPLLEQKGYGSIVLHSPWDNMEEELPALQKVIKERGIQKLLVDSYQVTPMYLERLSQMAKIIYIDDIDRFHYPVDALIYYAVDWESHHFHERYQKSREGLKSQGRMEGQKEGKQAGHKPRLLLGTEYAPLRKAFQNCGKKPIKPTTENLLLLSGGTDPYGILGKILEKMDRQRYGRVEVICGMYDLQYEPLRMQYQKEGNIHFYKAVPDMETHMGRADLAVAAGGATLYELCAMGVPTISYAMADNQIRNVEKFREIQLIDYAGDVRGTDVASHISRLLDKYFENAGLRQERSHRMQEFVDGQGAVRIAEGMINL